jgi:hypothetical protein
VDGAVKMRAKVYLDWKTGQRCRCCRKQRPGKAAKSGAWQGPAVVLALEK